MSEAAERLRKVLHGPKLQVGLVAQHNAYLNQKKMLEDKFRECSELYQEFVSSKQQEKADEAERNCFELLKQLDKLKNDWDHFMKTEYGFK
jgi:hypothetical protein